MLGSAEHDRLAEFQRRVDIGKHDRRGAVGNQRTVGALERPGDARVLFALGPAEVVAEVFANLRVRVADAVLVVFRGDLRQCVGLIAPALEIKSGDLAENSGEAAVDIGFFAYIRRLQEIAPNFGGRRRRHLLDADDEYDARGTCCDGLQPLMYGGRTGGTGVFHARGALEAQIGRGLENERGGEILRGEAGVEVAQHDFVDVPGVDAGVGERLRRYLHDQAFHSFIGQFAERRMRPSHNAGSHDCSLCRILVAFPWLTATLKFRAALPYPDSPLPSSLCFG